MYVYGDTIINEGSRTPAACLRDRLSQAYAAHCRAEDYGITLEPAYLEWLNYIYARARYGLRRPWTLPQADVVAYLRWLICPADPST